MSDLLKKGMIELGFSIEESEKLESMMETYIKELRLFNSAYNLVNTDDHDEIVVRHILDSFSAVQQIKRLSSELQSELGRSIVIGDIGSGGGLPGIPLASAMPDVDFVLIERMSKRCAFLENCIAILGLKNVTVKNVEAEHVEKESIDIAVFRAFRPLDKKMIKTLLNLLSQKGMLACYKAKREKIFQEMEGINFDKESYEILPLEVPFLTNLEGKESRERNLVVVRK